MDLEMRASSSVRAPWHGIALLVVSVMPFAALGCEPSCDELEHEIFESYKRCGDTDFLIDSIATCTEARRLGEECILSCFENVRCAPEGGDNAEASREIYGCIGYCNSFVYSPFSEEHKQ